MNTAPSTAASPATLELDYLPAAMVASQPAPWWQNVLGVVGFDQPPVIHNALAPVAASMTPSLGPRDLCEVWRIKDSRVHLSALDERRRIRFRYSNELLFGSLIIAEPAGATSSAALLEATETAYGEVFDLLDRTGHRHLIRIWNYLPDINAELGGDERYRHFNAARQRAFHQSGRATIGSVPAASALGSPAGSPLSIYFLAARRAPQMIENPRQTSAYHYPPQFGRHSPTFSRACLWGDATAANLFVSGTASIVGYESLHRDNVIAQTRETLLNIGTLVSEANRLTGFGRYSLEALALKVYVRRPADRAAIEAVLTETIRPARVVYLQADVCRADLLVEIEALG